MCEIAGGDPRYGGEPSSVLCDDLKGVGLGGGRKAPEGGDICIHTADSLLCTGEANNIIKQIYWTGKWQPIQVFWTGKFHEQRSLAGYNPWDHKESDTTEHARTPVFKKRSHVIQLYKISK